MNVVFSDRTKKPIQSCPKHSHGFWEIIINLAGENVSTIDGIEYKISKDDIMVIPPNIMHSGSSDTIYTDMYVQAKSLDFSGIVVVHDYDGSIRTLIKLLNKATTERENNHMTISDSLLETICLYIKKYSENSYNHEFVYSLKNEIYRNLDNPDFSIPHVVKAMCYNINYVHRCFKDDLGTTPLEYLRRLRIKRAKSLILQETFQSIEDVSEKCGFNDSFYFSKVFKSYVGISPSAFRKNNTNLPLKNK